MIEKPLYEPLHSPLRRKVLISGLSALAALVATGSPLSVFAQEPPLQKPEPRSCGAVTFRFPSPKTEEICNDSVFIERLQRAYHVLQDVFGVTKPLDPLWIREHYQDLSRKLGEVSLQEMRNHAGALARFFDGHRRTREYVKERPDSLLALSLGPHPWNYFSLLGRIVGKDDPESLWIATSRSAYYMTVDTLPAGARLLYRRGFRDVDAMEIGDLLRPTAQEKIRLVLDAAALHRKLGILHFDWFSEAVLQESGRTLRELQQPFVLYHVTREQDLNVMIEEPRFHDHVLLQELRGYNPLLMQAPNAQALTELIDGLYAQGVRNIPLYVINMHGEPKKMLASRYGGADQQHLGVENMENYAPALDKILAPDATIILLSCSTGKGADSVAETLARRLHRRVFAPNEDYSVNLFWFESPTEVYIGGMEISRWSKRQREQQKPYTPRRPFLERDVSRPEKFYTEQGKPVRNVTVEFYFPQ